MNFDTEMKEKVAQIERLLLTYIPKEEGYQKTVIEAMNYSLLTGGKRLRPLLMLETYKLFGGAGHEIEPFAAAIEMIHTYSLIHDDLPAMDNDEYRRGRKTNHVVYGEAIAILAGDGLLNYAFETALKSFTLSNNAQIPRALSIFAKRAGIYGMIGGQTADIEAEDVSKEVSKENLLFIHEHKTAALIQSAMSIGAILAGASEEDIIMVNRIGYDIGIAFQIQDDILDITGNLDTLGKQTGSDDKNNKTTYVTLVGLDEAKNEVESISNEAISILESLSYKNEFLALLIKQLVTREK